MKNIHLQVIYYSMFANPRSFLYSFKYKSYEKGQKIAHTFLLKTCCLFHFLIMEKLI